MKYKPVIVKGRLGLTPIDKEESKELCINGRLFFTDISGASYGVDENDMLPCTWYAYIQELLRLRTLENPANILRALKAINIQGYDEILDGLSEEYFFDFKNYLYFSSENERDNKQ